MNPIMPIATTAKIIIYNDTSKIVIACSSPICFVLAVDRKLQKYLILLTLLLYKVFLCSKDIAETSALFLSQVAEKGCLDMD